MEKLKENKLLKFQLNIMIALHIVLLVMVFLITILSIKVASTENKPIESDCKVNEELVVEDTNSSLQAQNEPLQTNLSNGREVYVTNYYVGDGSSTHKTGSGISTKLFEVNEKGWYTYEGRVVVASATFAGLYSDYGVLKNFKEENPNIAYYVYGDTFCLEIDNVIYECIVLDTCGASMDYEYLKKNDNGLNRIDIFIANKKYAFGKVKGTVLES